MDAWISIYRVKVEKHRNSGGLPGSESAELKNLEQVGMGAQPNRAN
jgi:hypothetical protein